MNKVKDVPPYPDWLCSICSPSGRALGESSNDIQHTTAVC